jgi:hypothetical protein
MGMDAEQALAVEGEVLLAVQDLIPQHERSLRELVYAHGLQLVRDFTCDVWRGTDFVHARAVMALLVEMLRLSSPAAVLDDAALATMRRRDVIAVLFEESTRLTGGLGHLQQGLIRTLLTWRTMREMHGLPVPRWRGRTFDRLVEWSDVGARPVPGRRRGR